MFDLLENAPNTEIADRIAKLKQSIFKEGAAGKRQWEFDELRHALMVNGWFAQFSEKDFRAACKELHAEGKIERISDGRGWSRGTEFTIRPE